MNKVILIGRLTKNVDVRTVGEKFTKVARYTLAVDREFKREGEASADFIDCVVFGKSAEFAEKYFSKGLKIAICGRIQTSSYEKSDGQRVYVTNVMVEKQEFVESKNARNNSSDNASNAPGSAFVDIPDYLDDEVPFN